MKTLKYLKFFKSTFKYFIFFKRIIIAFFFIHQLAIRIQFEKCKRNNNFLKHYLEKYSSSIFDFGRREVSIFHGILTEYNSSNETPFISDGVGSANGNGFLLSFLGSLNLNFFSLILISPSFYKKIIDNNIEITISII